MADTYDYELPPSGPFNDWKASIPFLVAAVDQHLGNPAVWEDDTAGLSYVMELIAWLLLLEKAEISAEVTNSMKLLSVQTKTMPATYLPAGWSDLHQDFNVILTTTSKYLVSYLSCPNLNPYRMALGVMVSGIQDLVYMAPGYYTEHYIIRFHVLPASGQYELRPRVYTSNAESFPDGYSDAVFAVFEVPEP